MVRKAKDNQAPSNLTVIESATRLNTEENTADSHDWVNN